MHVSLDFEFSLHEGSLGVELSSEKVNCVVVHKAEGGVSLALLALLDGSASVLEINSPSNWLFALGLCDFEVVNCFDLVDDFSSTAGEVGFHLVEENCNLKRHITYEKTI